MKSKVANKICDYLYHGELSRSARDALVGPLKHGWSWYLVTFKNCKHNYYFEIKNDCSKIVPYSYDRQRKLKDLKSWFKSFCKYAQIN